MKIMSNDILFQLIFTKIRVVSNQKGYFGYITNLLDLLQKLKFNFLKSLPNNRKDMTDYLLVAFTDLTFILLACD